MNTPKTIVETDLHAFVDGELDQAAQADVEAWLADHPEDAAKVHAWRLQKKQFHASFDDILEEAVPLEMKNTLTRRPTFSRLPSWRSMAAALALFIAGAAAGWGLNDYRAGWSPDDRNFVRQAVGAHAVFVSEVLHPVEVGAEQEAHLVGWLSKRLGQPLRAPRLVSSGFQLMGGRLLAEENRPAAQLMYEDDSGRRVTLYVRSGRQGADTAFRFVAEQDMSAFYWKDGPLAYALTGRMPRADLLELARVVYQELES